MLQPFRSAVLTAHLNLAVFLESILRQLFWQSHSDGISSGSVDKGREQSSQQGPKSSQVPRQKHWNIRYRLLALTPQNPDLVKELQVTESVREWMWQDKRASVYKKCKPIKIYNFPVINYNFTIKYPHWQPYKKSESWIDPEKNGYKSNLKYLFLLPFTFYSSRKWKFHNQIIS